jgi:hypothetical protein
MNIENLNTIEALDEFPLGSQPIAFSVLGNKAQRYDFIRKTLVKFHYSTLSKKDKGTVIRYLQKMTDYSRQQITRLISQYVRTGKIDWVPCRHNGFTKKYTDNDIFLLTKTDELHDTPCGSAVKKLCERAHDVFDDKAYHRYQKYLYLICTI